MTLDQLKYFIAAASYQHVGRAAKAIAISPSAISSAIAALEAELDCALFHRRAKRIGLTAKGEQLKELAEKLVEQVDNIPRQLQGEQMPLQKRFRLGASHVLAHKVLAGVWNEIQEGYPGIIGELYSVNSAQLVAEVASGKYDLGLCFTPVKHSELDEVEVYNGDLVIGVRKNHPLLKQSPQRRLEKLNEYPGATYRTPDLLESRRVHPVLDRFGLEPRFSFFFDSDDIALQRLRTTDTWGLLPDIILDLFSEHLVAVAKPTGWKAPFQISVVKHKERKLEEVLVATTNLIKERFKRGLAG